ncbi:hypothetical protein Acr_11g0006940 [Actinidia rufa]|uniref:CCHC-type domain-containing protein n=1 Tax=Actinidia rufa TaxID=165716 RepID=A0A7J0FCK9_9ERIC|nr:hypothetical protein Acr_11g0006940 [Actinidia rufa]
MEDILFCKDLHDPLENKGEKPIAKKDEEWRKMNRKTIGLIRQCIGHEVFHHVAQETSAYELWIKLEEMYQAKTSQNKALLMRRLVNLKLQRETTVAEHTKSWETLVVSLSNSTPNGKLTTSMVMDALFNKEARRREKGSTDQSESQALVSEESRERGRGKGKGHHRGTEKGWWRSQARGRTVRCFYCDQEGHIKRDCPKYKAQDQSSDTAATVVMADDDEIDVLLAASDNEKSNWVLDSGSAYHLCRVRDVLSIYAACEGRIWMANNTASRVIGRGSVRFRMADGRDAALMLVEEFSEFSRETRRCCGERRLEGYTDWRGVYRQVELLSDMGPVVLARRMDKGSNRFTEVRKASAGVPRESRVKSSEEGDQVNFEKLYSERRSDAEASLFCSRFDQWRYSLQLCAQGRRDGATTTHKVMYFVAHPGGGGHPSGGGARHLGEKSYGGAGSEAVKKDNLKTSDYPPVGWRGRLLSSAHLDESKPTWMSPSSVAKPKPDWSSYGVSM